MATADDWHNLGTDFERLDPDERIVVSWTWLFAIRTHEFTITNDSTGHLLEAKFEALCSKCGELAGLEEPFHSWLAQVRASGHSEDHGTGMVTDIHGIEQPYDNGRLVKPMEACAALCYRMEASVRSPELPNPLVPLPKRIDQVGRIDPDSLVVVKLGPTAEEAVEIEAKRQFAVEQKLNELRYRSKTIVVSRDDAMRLIEMKAKHNASEALKKSPRRKRGKPTPATLVARYFAQFPEKITILDVCWAAGERYREWKRWVGNQCPTGSKPDRSLRAILMSGKRPLEYRAQPRPPKWQ